MVKYCSMFFSFTELSNFTNMSQNMILIATFLYYDLILIQITL